MRKKRHTPEQIIAKLREAEVWYAGSGAGLEIYMTDISETNPVPSVSLGGLALLGGMVFTIALAGLAAERLRRAG